MNLVSTYTVNKYSLEGGVKFTDKTDGQVEVIYLEEDSQDNRKQTYAIAIHGKKLICPTDSDPKYGEFNLVGSRKITVKAKDSLFKISEVDSLGKNVFYVDTSKDVKGIAYDTYNYVPKEICISTAKEKVKDIRSDYPSFEPDMAVFNRHGVAVFGFDKEDKAYALFWANPYQDSVRKVKCFEIARYRDGGTSVAKASSGFVNFRYNAESRNYYLNAEPARAFSI